LRHQPTRARFRVTASPEGEEFTDIRRVFDRPNDFDAVVVSTAEHTHAVATYLALTHGKHVYCEKPLAYNIWETRVIRETAAKYPKLSTQMGNQGHASAARRTIREILDTGVIGPVREVHVWADRAWGLQDAASAEKFDKPHGFYNGIQIVERFKEKMPVPSTLTGICGSALRPSGRSTRPISRTAVVSVVGFRQRHDERPGSHDNDVPFTCSISGGRTARAGACWPRSPSRRFRPTCRCRTRNWRPRRCGQLFSLRQSVRSRHSSWCGIRATASRRAGWSRGDKRSWRVHGRERHAAGQRKTLSEERFKDFKPPPATLPRSPGHWVEWVN
jgi:hypothetical protein